MWKKGIGGLDKERERERKKKKKPVEEGRKEDYPFIEEVSQNEEGEKKSM